MLCIHCLKELDKSSRSRDHVFPSSWYSDDTPVNVQRWTAPSCAACNNKFGRLENDLFIRLAMCVDPKQSEASGITKKLMRSFGVGPDAGDLSEEERKIRKKLLIEVWKESFTYSKGIKPFPGFGPYTNFPLDKQRAIKVPKDILIPVLGKVYRGVEYVLGNNRYIMKSEKLKIYHVEEEPEEIANLINNFSTAASLGPGFKIFRVENKSDIILYKAIIWGKWISYASLDII